MSSYDSYRWFYTIICVAVSQNWQKLILTAFWIGPTSPLASFIGDALAHLKRLSFRSMNRFVPKTIACHNTFSLVNLIFILLLFFILSYPLICSLAGIDLGSNNLIFLYVLSNIHYWQYIWGLAAGMFGIGGGIVKGPLMLEMGTLPEGTSKTTKNIFAFSHLCDLRDNDSIHLHIGVDFLFHFWKVEFELWYNPLSYILI